MLTLILGGARSGKSSYALDLCKDAADVVYIATAVPGEDEEMQNRISRHRSERPDHWKTIEEPLDVAGVVHREASQGATLLVDCVTMWISNLLWEHRFLAPDERETLIAEEVKRLVRASREAQVIAVTNEVGSGLVPNNPVGRAFRDVHGLANQLLAKEAQRVILMVAGLPLTVKGGHRQQDI